MKKRTGAKPRIPCWALRGENLNASRRIERGHFAFVDSRNASRKNAAELRTISPHTRKEEHVVLVDSKGKVVLTEKERRRRTRALRLRVEK